MERISPGGRGGGDLFFLLDGREEKKWGVFPECRTPKGFVHLEFVAMHGMVHPPSGGAYSSTLVR